MSILPLINRLAADDADVEPVYVLYGPEGFLVDHAVSRIRELLSGGDTGEMNFEKLRGPETTIAQVIDLAREVPLFGGRRMIVVGQAEDLRTDRHEFLVQYCDKPSKSNCLVFTATALDTRKKPWNALKKKNLVYKATSMNEREIRGFLRSRALRRKKQLSPGSASALLSLAGSDLKALDDALERLSLFVGQRKSIEPRDIMQVVSDDRLRSVFEITDAIGEKDASKALSVLSRVLRQQERAIGINHLLARQMRQLLVCSTMRGSSREKLASVLGLPPFIAGKIRKQSERYSPGDIEKALRIAADADLQLKSSPLSDEMILDRAVLELCMGKVQG